MWECYKMLDAGTYQIMMICHFCCIWCVHHMSIRSTCVLNYNMTSLQRCKSCIFVINMVTRTSMQTRLRDVADFSPCSAVILMPCKLDATVIYMLVLGYFSKDALNMWLCSIHSCLWLKLWSALVCNSLALLLLYIIHGSLLTC